MPSTNQIWFHSTLVHFFSIVHLFLSIILLFLFYTKECSLCNTSLLSKRSQYKIFYGQDSANNSTPLRYSKNNHQFVNYSCMNLSKRTPSNLTWVRVEYLYVRQIWQILVELSRIELRYLCFRPFMGHSQLLIRLWPIFTNFYYLTWVQTRLLYLKTCLIFNIRLGVE